MSLPKSGRALGSTSPTHHPAAGFLPGVWTQEVSPAELQEGCTQNHKNHSSSNNSNWDIPKVSASQCKMKSVSSLIKKLLRISTVIAEHKTKSVALLSKGTCVTIGCTSKKPALPTTHAGAGQNILHPRVLLTTKWLDFELLQRVQ